MPTPPDGKMLWLDIETTGLNPATNKILEIGMIITDSDLVEKARRSWVIPFTGQVDEFIAKMHGVNGSGLLTECGDLEWCPPTKINTEIAAWLSDLLQGEKPPLCGSSVHFDRSFVQSSPFFHLLKHAGYRNIDVSTLKELAHRWAPRTFESRPKPGAKHRALPDLDDSIAELRHYRATLFANPAHYS